MSICTPLFDDVCLSNGQPIPCCGNGTREAWEVCDESNANSEAWAPTRRCNTTCDGYGPHCGDGLLNPTYETCDDGDEMNSNLYGLAPHCNRTCSGYAGHCGDGFVQNDEGEVCDNGPKNSDSYSRDPECNSTCSGYAPHCGDGIRNGDEICDDGAENGDLYSFASHCNSICTGTYQAFCGDGVTNLPDGESCDDHNDIQTDDCPSGPNGPCQEAHCGDGYLWERMESCDPGIRGTQACTNLGRLSDGTTSCDPQWCIWDQTQCESSWSELVWIPAGSFWMGSPEDEVDNRESEALHEVTLTSAFFISRRETTQADWTNLLADHPTWAATPWVETTCGDDCPLENLNFYEALHFANALSEAHGLTPCYVLEGCTDTPLGEGKVCSENIAFQGSAGESVPTPYACEGYRLPTEAEWEYAYRAGSNTALYTGPLTTTGCELSIELDDIAWYCGNSSFKTQPTMLKRPNKWGLFDMSGNVLEWVWDRYGSYEGPATNPIGAQFGTNRGIRGGGWVNSAERHRGAFRNSESPSNRAGYIGFRLVRTDL